MSRSFNSRSPCKRETAQTTPARVAGAGRPSPDSAAHGPARLGAWTVAVVVALLQACAASDGSRMAMEPESRKVLPDAAVRAHESAVHAMQIGDATEAELELERLALSYPELAEPHVNLAILHMQAGRDDEALSELEQALAIEETHPAANNQLGILLRRQGRFEEAEKAYLTALRAAPDYALAHYNLGVLLDLYLRRPAEALRHYQRYQELQSEPDETVARWIIDLKRRVGVADDARVAREGAS